MYSDMSYLVKTWELFLCSDRKHSSEKQMTGDVSACKEDNFDLKPKATRGKGLFSKGLTGSENDQ